MRAAALAMLAAVLLAAPSAAAETEALRAAIEDIRAASLARDPQRAARHLATDLMLISQSGRLYDRNAMLADLASGSENWTVEEQVTESDGALARVLAIVRRARAGAPEGRFRVLQLWRTTYDDRWELFAQATVRIAE